MGVATGPDAADKAREEILAHAQALRWEVGGDFHERLVEAIYTDAARIAGTMVARRMIGYQSQPYVTRRSMAGWNPPEQPAFRLLP